MIHYSGHDRTVKEYINMKLDGEDYDRGQLEAIEKTAANCKELLANLSQHLVDSNIMKESDVEKLCEGMW